MLPGDEDRAKKLKLLATEHWHKASKQLTRLRHDSNDVLQRPSTIVLFVLGVGVGLAMPRLRRPFRRFATVEDIPPQWFQEARQLKAVAVTCSDGDTFRARHVPLFRGVGRFAGKVSDHTLQIRVAGIDAPEMAKFGHPGQPFGEEAKKWLTTTLEGKKLTLTLLHKDQYARAVCLVHYGWWPFRRDASEEMLKAGLAHVYRQAGAVFGGKQAIFERLEEEAKAKGVGIWSQKKKVESSGDFKARMRAR
ncbi:hypothetical protein PsorP6_018084 [Peronosclerospora sorghi]|uniref:Uncharacterized protein n=1 Tax=Peronosclerospora sorghi TaxID=230839 RepID=A0ACC0WF34_9STRA|nr:hypothetical protein PsorP6_018084 [Peronosclerospora sorghi]